ncbi:ABC transporter ATP-binding protein [Parasphaerochaeta coccoides]|uniref:Amino acid/amide ABC transporter ATP-binding protein 2, HAAT family n=1 Tax=Parasphaerochaeta coccoides (strain ATCC BAA-1237 / DSM 17374 / SPN1) TaxID=760011 RepID=F4GHZ4_PARC1|nr:ABC transporter ATP-binding protein [Parasphaerochaeta coccoides]AEC02107.1 amino acid/amide ABC transporter ATP-binding protein 2, HAAT family [Parasphaerochaeta coccoides DSM 17374]
MLSIRNLDVHYGGIHALRGISFDVPDGKIVTLIGANGAGKSTTLHAIMGLLDTVHGSVSYDGQETMAWTTKQRVENRLILVPEGRRIFPDLTVFENLKLGAYTRNDHDVIERDYQKVFSLFPRLQERCGQKAGTLSGGEQQMLAVGRALMSSPRMLLMDEPSLGLSPLLTAEIIRIITEINKTGVTVLLVEQNARAALEIADFAYVLETGEISRQGTGAELLADKSIIAAYLGD